MSSPTPPKDSAEVTAPVAPVPVKKWVQFEDDERRKSQSEGSEPPKRSGK